MPLILNAIYITIDAFYNKHKKVTCATLNGLSYKIPNTVSESIMHIIQVISLCHFDLSYAAERASLQLKMARYKDLTTAKKANYGHTFKKCQVYTINFKAAEETPSDSEEGCLGIMWAEGEGIIWAKIYSDKLISPYKVDDGVKLISQNCCEFLDKTFYNPDIINWLLDTPTCYMFLLY